MLYLNILLGAGSLSRAFRLNQSNANLFTEARTGLLDRWTRFIVIKQKFLFFKLLEKEMNGRIISASVLHHFGSVQQFL